MTITQSRIRRQGERPGTSRQPASSRAKQRRRKTSESPAGSANPPVRKRGGKASEPPASIANPPAKKRGGQPGNTNRLVHGYYSRRLPRQWTSPPDPRSGLQPEFEIALARIHLADLLVAQQKAPRKHYLTYERLIMNYMGRIIALMRTALKRRRVRPDAGLLLQELRRRPRFMEELTPGIRTTFEPQASGLGLPVTDP